MKLFEVTNGWVGESYVRAYVWAIDEVHALDIFALRHLAQKKTSSPPVIKTIEELLDSSSPAFSTLLSDSGWEI